MLSDLLVGRDEMPAPLAESLAARRPDVEWVDFTPRLDALRVIKDAHQLAQHRRGAAICDAMFESLARGYMSQAGAFLTPAEKSFIAFAGKLITFTIGLRFLTDYISGDKYFRVHRAGHNLDRARTQFKLVDSITRHEEPMQKFVDGL